LTSRQEMLLRGHAVASSTLTIEGKRIGECPK